ncbi:hypothetical protein RB195_020778 [Necator americanus]|uniref:Uncharacterized protein n=1 Tax=Necator americanus TaxID=51031 RepID=A0ABR1CKN0_NECAM
MMLPLIFFVFSVFQSANGIKCWLWHLDRLPNEQVSPDIRGVLTQCHFRMDVPCFTRKISFSAYTTVEFLSKRRNECYIDPNHGTQVRCVCDTDNCSTNCTNIVDMWRKSPDFKTTGPHAKCMDRYEKACVRDKIKPPVKGENMEEEYNRTIDEEEG